MSKGTLYLLATPIGNLGDMTLRGIEVLKSVDLIAAEDTRNSIKLLNHFDVHTPMTSYHEHNRFEKAEELVALLLEGKDIACITDAGTPGISDPGEVLVKRCVEEEIPVTSVPGPAALISALILSGFSTRRFRFEGFLPAEKKERENVLKGLEKDPATLVFYEAPHRLLKTVGTLYAALGERRAAFCKELTKKHEDIRRLPLSAALEFYEKEAPRGEYVIVVEGADTEKLKAEEQQAFSALSLEAHMQRYLDAGLDRKEAMKKVAEDRGVPKREIYRALLTEESGD